MSLLRSYVIRSIAILSIKIAPLRGGSAEMELTADELQRRRQEPEYGPAEVLAYLGEPSS